MPRKPRVICRRGTLTQFHQRVAIHRTRIYKDKQYIQRIEEFSNTMLSRHRRIISLPRIHQKDQQEHMYICVYTLILDRFHKNSIIHAVHFQNNQNDIRCITFCILQSACGDDTLPWKLSGCTTSLRALIA